MCWNSILQIDKREHIAEEDIPMFKMMMVNGQTPFRCYPIKFGIKLATVELFIDEGLNGDLVITQGFHSYSTKVPLIETVNGYGIRNHQYRHNCLPHKGYIPKGSTYYINNDGFIVSDSLVVLDEEYEDIRYNNFPCVSLLFEQNGNFYIKKILYENIGRYRDAIGYVYAIGEKYIYFHSLLEEDWKPMSSYEGSSYKSSLVKENYKIYNVSKTFNNLPSHEYQSYNLMRKLGRDIDMSMPYYDEYYGVMVDCLGLNSTEQRGYFINAITIDCDSVFGEKTF